MTTTRLFNSPFMTSVEVAAIFRVDPKTVTRWNWPEGTWIKTPGGRLRYRREFVESLINDGRDVLS